GEADKKAKEAFEKRDGQDWPTAAKYYGEEVEILEKLYGQYPDNANIKSALMKALRRSSTSAAHLSMAKEVPDWKEKLVEETGKYPSAKTPQRDKEIRGELRDVADKHSSRLWDLIKDEKGKEGDKSTVLLEWGENDLFRAQAKDAEGKA